VNYKIDAPPARAHGLTRFEPAAPRRRPSRRRPDLDPLAAAWHLLNFFAPAVGIGFFASALAKLFWRSALKGASWLRLWAFSSAGAALVLVAGLVVFAHDGRLTTYAAMTLATAVSLWWFGFRPLRR
jgi:hypothetical protein